MSNNLEKLTQLAKELDVLEISRIVLDNPKFAIWSGSSKPQQHHYGLGGLAAHTLEVVELCLKNNEYFSTQGKSVNPSHLFLAALFHDVGKMWDYEPTNSSCTEWKSSPHKRSIHHISRSALVWNEVAVKYDTFTIDWRDEVLHAILAHHGQREYGSPVSPNSKMAWLLHLCDGMSARMDDVLKFDRV